MTDMQEDDVWDLSPAMQSRPVFIKFSTLEYAQFYVMSIILKNIMHIASQLYCDDL